MQVPTSIVTKHNHEIIIAGNVFVRSIGKLSHGGFAQLAKLRWRRNSRGEKAGIAGKGIPYRKSQSADGVLRCIQDALRYPVVF